MRPPRSAGSFPTKASILNETFDSRGDRRLIGRSRSHVGICRLRGSCPIHIAGTDRRFGGLPGLDPGLGFPPRDRRDYSQGPGGLLPFIGPRPGAGVRLRRIRRGRGGLTPLASGNKVNARRIRHFDSALMVWLLRRTGIRLGIDDP